MGMTRLMDCLLHKIHNHLEPKLDPHKTTVSG